MAKYIAYQIYMGAMDYDEAVSKYPKLQNDIDRYLAEFKQENI